MNVAVLSPQPGPLRLGAHVLAQRLRACGVSVTTVDSDGRPPAQASLPWGDRRIEDRPTSIWCLSVLSHRDWQALPQLRRRIQGRLVIGGQCADLMRGWGLAFCDVLVVGDCHHVDIKGVVADGSGVVDTGQAPCPPPPVETTAGLTVFAASGCARRCPYCRISWTHRYTEAPVALVEASILRYRDKRVSVYSPSGDAANIEGLIVFCQSQGKTITNKDFHPHVARRLLEKGLLSGVRIRMGIEGVSERLRASIGRRLTWEGLGQLMATSSTHQYYLAGIPGEAESDWVEFEEQMLKILSGARFTHWITLGTLTPIPGTPWGGIDGHWSEATDKRISRFKQRLVDLNRTGIKAILATARSRDTHEEEVALMRAAVLFPDRMPVVLGKKDWRKAFLAAGVDVDALLSPQGSLTQTSPPGVRSQIGTVD